MADQPQASFYQQHKTAVWVGGGLVVAVGGYFLYKHFTQSSSTTSSTTATTGSAVAPVYVGYAPTSMSGRSVSSGGTAAGVSPSGTSIPTNSQTYTQLLAQEQATQASLNTLQTKFETYINKQNGSNNPGGSGSQTTPAATGWTYTTNGVHKPVPAGVNPFEYQPPTTKINRTVTTNKTKGVIPPFIKRTSSKLKASTANELKRLELARLR